MQHLRNEEKAALESIEGENFKISNDRPHDVHVQTWTIGIAIENKDEKNSEEPIEESARNKIPGQARRLLPGEQQIPIRTASMRMPPLYLPMRQNERSIQRSLRLQLQK